MLCTTRLPNSGENVSLVVVAILFWASRWLARLGLPHPTTGEILAKAPVSRTSAFGLSKHVDELKELLVKPRGRPPKRVEVEAASRVTTIAEKTLDYVMMHPGCVSGGGKRKRYSEGFKEFAVSIVDAHQDWGFEQLGRALRVPSSTLEQWSKRQVGEHEENPKSAPESPCPAPNGLRVAYCETIVTEFASWRGDFSSFCEHVRENLGIPLGKTAVSSILEAFGKRIPNRRAGRSPDEEALRQKFLTFFPNAQWCGDGSLVSVEIDGERFLLNLELNVDTHSGAFVGAHVSPTEDSQAVIEAFDDAVKTTGTKPQAILLDNKPSNHSPEVEAAASDTIIIRSTGGRPQNKAHVEGGFGLFKPLLENIKIDASTKHRLAATILAALVTVWGRTINHRPRKDRGGLTRVEIAGQKPTPEEIEHARKALLERKRRQDEARETRKAKLDPVVNKLIREAFERLELLDPGDHFLLAIARYPRDVVIEALAIYGSKKKTGSLPDGVDARYLLGIARNIADERELWATSRELWQLRVRARDEMSRLLEIDGQELEYRFPKPEDFARQAIKLAAASELFFVSDFWVKSAVARVKNETNIEAIYQNLARELSRNFSVNKTARATVLRLLAEKLLPS
jgi:transposase InsO family protein